MTHDDHEINDAPEELDSFDLTGDAEISEEELVIPGLEDDAEPGLDEEPDFFAEEK